VSETTPIEIKLRMLIETVQEKLEVSCVNFKAGYDCYPHERRITDRWTACGGRINSCEVKPEDLK